MELCWQYFQLGFIRLEAQFGSAVDITKNADSGYGMDKRDLSNELLADFGRRRFDQVLLLPSTKGYIFHLQLQTSAPSVEVGFSPVVMVISPMPLKYRAYPLLFRAPLLNVGASLTPLNGSSPTTSQAASRPVQDGRNKVPVRGSMSAMYHFRYVATCTNNHRF